MGIYPTTEVKDHIRNSDGSESWTEVYNDYSGIIRTRTVHAEPYTEERKNCFCCSCSANDIDPYCRQHGCDGMRPCEQHRQPGEVNDQDEMPTSVQSERRRLMEHERSLVQHWKEVEGRG